MNLRINGENREVADNLSLKELVTQLTLTPERIAVELNQNVVRRANWPSTLLKEDDRVEIVHFVGGGEAVADGRWQEQEAGVNNAGYIQNQTLPAPASCSCLLPYRAR